MKKVLLVALTISVLHTSAQKLNQTILDSIINQSQRTNSNALLVYRDGKLVYKNYFGKPVQPIEAMSASKSIVSIAIGLLMDKGYLENIDVPVAKFYPEWRQGNKKNITVRHLLDHTSGIQNVPNAGIEIEVAPDVIQLALCAELDDMPGKRFSYNNKASNLLSGIVEKASGLPLDKFLQQHLFTHLAIKDFSWMKDKAGNPLGMSGFQVLPEDLAKIGLLMLNKGKWNDKQVLSEQWIDQMFSPSEGDINYGFEWWLLYEKQVLVVDDNLLQPVRAGGDTAAYQLLQKLEGKYAGGMNEMRTRAESLFTKTELAIAAKALSAIPQATWKIESSGPIVGYVASGYLGQNLVIIPAKKLVVVRMITSENFKKIPGNSQFAQLRTLAKQL